jgi:UDP-N-acetylmuramoylalanine--D-glutamate ligase
MIRNWQDMRVLIIGAARQGQALARFLSSQGAYVTLNDVASYDELLPARQALADLPITWVYGSHPLELLETTEIVCISGGIPLTLPIILEATRRGLQPTNDTQIFMEVCPCPIVAITGSAGKTTTTTLVGRIAQHGFTEKQSVWVGGNIGLPLISQVDRMKPEDLVVMEVSSFQLEQITLSPQVAVVLNITPNHLDRHGTMKAYAAIKARILACQNDQDTAVLGRDDPEAWKLSAKVSGKLVSFGLAQPPAGQIGTFRQGNMLCLQERDQIVPIMPVSTVCLRGEHNLLNVLAACAAAYAAGVPLQSMQAGIDGFNGVPHRLQLIATKGGTDWYNDSIATAPERSMAAIRSFSEPLVLLAGGRDKKLPWNEWADMVHQRVDHLVVFGEAASLILKAIGPQVPGRRPYTIVACQTLHEAVRAAEDITTPGDVVLLSPGGTSFDQFRDFEQRGECFEKWVKELS